MKRLLCAALLLGACSFPAQAAPGPTVLLAVPVEDFSQWRSLAGLLASYGDLKLTLALTPDMLTPQVRDDLAPLMRTGRVELAMRIPGDPILPLVVARAAAGDLQDISARLALAHEKFRALLSTATAGFVPGGGALTQDLLPILQARAVPWVAVGSARPSQTNPSAAPREPIPLPFTALREPQRPPTSEDLAACADAARQDARPVEEANRIVLDEAGGLVPPGSFMALLRDLAKKRPSRNWETVSQSLPKAAPAPGPSAAPAPYEKLEVAQGQEPPPPPQAAPQDWPGWSASSWSGTPASTAAWKAYHEATAALRRYQNSGTADLKAWENATEALHAAQASRYYRLLSQAQTTPLPEEQGQADGELRRHLRDVYRKLQQAAPGALYASFWGDSATSSAATSGEEVSTDLRIEHGSDWISFQNPAGSLSRAPESEPSSSRPAPASRQPAQPWKILSLRVEWNTPDVAFSYRMAALEASTSTAQGSLGRLVLDTYVDINHVPGAGSCDLLEGRGAFAANRDCWEYALSLNASGASLWRAAPDSGVTFLAALPVSVDAARQTVRVVAPRSLLRGTPLRWGYIVAAFAAPPAAAKGPSSLAGAASVLPGGPLGILAPLEQQQALTAGGRLNAVRVPAP